MTTTIADVRDAMEVIRQAVGGDAIFSLSWDGSSLTAVLRQRNALPRQQATFDPEDLNKPVSEIACELARFFAEQPVPQRRT